jgi:3-hydroxy-9,10-secoandrosta-1,3,5(10)-triene-9,17-dione monooxygenase reductase component
MSSEGFRGQATPLTGEEFRHACGRFATGITIATVRDAQGVPHGLTVNSFTSVSLTPPLISICLAHSVSLIEIFRAASYFGINVLAENQRPLSERFARKGRDRFDGIEWQFGPHQVPLIAGVLAAFECRAVERFRAGDHDIFLAEMVTASIAEGKPLVYFASRYRRLGE